MFLIATPNDYNYGLREQKRSPHRTYGQNKDDTLSQDDDIGHEQAQAQDVDQQSAGSLTPTASRQDLNNFTDTAVAQSQPQRPDGRHSYPSPWTTATRDRPPLLSLPSNSDALSTIAPSTFAPSTIAPSTTAYAPSSVNEDTSLLPYGRRYTEPHLHKTKGRKAFVAMCKTVNIFVPIEINDEATDMSESSIIKTSKFLQDKTEALRNGRHHDHVAGSEGEAQPVN